MQCRVTILDTTGTIYTFYEKEENESKQRNTQRRRVERENEKLRNRRKKLSCPPQGMWQSLGKNELKKKKKSLLVNRVGLRTKGN